MAVRPIWLVFLWLSVQAVAQPVSRSDREPWIFSVDGRPVTSDEFKFLFRKNHPRKEDYTPEKAEAYLGLLTAFKLKVAEARAEGLDTTVDYRKELLTYRAELKKPYLAEKDDVDRLTREAYERMKEEIKASHVLITLRPDASPEDTLKAWNKALSVRERLTSGASFPLVANETSEDPSARLNGGNLGYFSVLQMVYPFEEACYRLKVGEISAPVRTRFGYHIIEVFDRRPSRGEVEVSHIILRTGNGDHQIIRNKIFEIYQQLEAGRNWDELCRTYSDDPATKNTGGRLKPFGVGVMSAIPEFESTAFALNTPGEISDPFQSAYGWHLIRLERKIPVPTWEEASPLLSRKVARDERLKVAEAKALEVRKAAVDFKAQPAVVEKMMGLADSSLLQGAWKYRGPAAWLKENVLSTSSKTYTVGDWVSFIRLNQSYVPLAPRAAMQQWYERFSAFAVDEAEDAKLRGSNAEYRNLIREYEEGLLLFGVMEKHVWNKASRDTAGLRQFYEKNKSRYQAGERLEARVFSSTDPALIAEVKRKVEKGDSITRDDVKRLKAVLPLRRYARGDHPAIDRIPWSIGIHEATVDGTTYLIGVTSLVAPGIRALQEVKAQVIADYQEELERLWVAELKQKHTVKTNTKAKKSVIAELIQTQ